MAASDQEDPVTPSSATADVAAEPSVTNADPAAPLEAQLAAAQREATEAQDRYLRSLADLDNFRRRAMREKEELRQFAASRVLEDLLPVLDNLTLGLQATRQPNAEVKTLADGVEMVLTQLRATLDQHGLKEVAPLGEPFDPNLHEAVSLQAHPTIPEGSVASVVRPGYTLNGRLLRAAAVHVSSGPAPTQGEA